MESGIRSIFLMRALGALVLGLFWFSAGIAQEDEPPQVIEPEVERRELDVAAIDTEDFELTGFIGVMSIEDFESGLVYGARLAYHVNEAFFGEVSYGRTEVGDSSIEVINDVQLFSNRTLQYYDISLGWNILPGEVFVGEGRAWNSTFYLIGGVGSTDFADDNYFTANFGFGFKFLPTDFFAVRVEFRDYLYSIDIVSESDKLTNNLQSTLNVSWFF